MPSAVVLTTMRRCLYEAQGRTNFFSEVGLFSFLVVDDEQDAANSLADILRLAGHACIVAYDGRSALAEARQVHIDGVILDINMPGLDGYETASCFLSAQVTQAPTLIALTALSSRQAKSDAMRIGFNAFLTKPVNPSLLIDLMTMLITERRRGVVLHEASVLSPASR